MALVFDTSLRDSYVAHARLVGPFNYLNADGQETGMMLGATKDTYAKISLLYDASGGAILQFVLEQRGIPLPPTYQILPDVDSIKTLDLIIVANPETATLLPIYMANGQNPQIIVPEGVRIKGASIPICNSYSVLII